MIKHLTLLCFALCITATYASEKRCLRRNKARTPSSNSTLKPAQLITPEKLETIGYTQEDRKALLTPDLSLITNIVATENQVQGRLPSGIFFFVRPESPYARIILKSGTAKKIALLEISQHLFDVMVKKHAEQTDHPA